MDIAFNPVTQILAASSTNIFAKVHKAVCTKIFNGVLFIIDRKI